MFFHAVRKDLSESTAAGNGGIRGWSGLDSVFVAGASSAPLLEVSLFRFTYMNMAMRFCQSEFPIFPGFAGLFTKR
jgi:hypothetical protein